MGKKKVSKQNFSHKSPSVFPVPQKFNESVQTDSVNNHVRLQRLQQEVEDSIREILNEFLNDFLTRKQKRLESKNPNTHIHTYNLVVNKSYKKKIRKQVNILILSNLSSSLHTSLSDQIHKFVLSFSAILKDLSHISKLLQIIFLYEAFHSLQNVSDQIAGIIAGVYKNHKDSIEFMFNKEFFINIVANSQDLIKQSADYDKNHFAIQGLTRMQSILLISVDKQVDLQVSTIPIILDSESSSESEGQSEEPLYNLPLEELVMYIEGGRNRKKDKRRTATTSASPNSEDFTELDKEIDEFRQRIDIPMSPQRLSVKLSKEFIENLREKLKNSIG